MYCLKVLSAATVLTLTLCAVAVEIPENQIFPSSINVKAFGAVGDGKTDDTAAIQRAAEEAARWNVSMRAGVGHRYNRGRIGDGPQKSIVFPAGTYRITDTVFFKRDVILRGVGKAVIRQENPAKDLFYFNSAFRCRVDNLAFDGGKRQLLFWTANNDSANLTVKNCTFQNSSGAAVESLSHRIREANGKWRNVGAYRIVKENGVESLREDLRDQAQSYANSTLLTIENCFFTNCFRAAEFRCDGAVIRNTRVVTSFDQEGGAFRIGNKIHAYQLDILVKRNPAKKQYVFECIGRTNFCFEDSVIRTDSGKGVCTVYSEAAPGYIATSFILRNLKTESAQSSEQSILFLAKGAVPNLIAINGIAESGGMVRAIGFEEPVTEESLKTNRYFKNFPLEKSYQFAIGKNSASVDGRVPEAFEPFRTAFPTVPAPLPRPQEPEFRGKILYAGDYGVDTDPKTDDTAAVKKLFAEASKQKGSVIVFPGTWVQLSETVTVPDSVAVTSAGVTGFRSSNEIMDLFRISGVSAVRLSNLMFQGGRHSVNISVPESMPSNILMDNCYFYDAASYAVYARAGKEMNPCPNQLSVRMNGGVAFTAKLYCGNASNAFSDAQWLSTLPEVPKDTPMKECVTIRNYGRLQITDMLTVPMAFAWSSMSAPVPKDTIPGDFRWIDNYGELFCWNVRFGGEWGGLSPIYHYGRGRVWIEGGYPWFESPRTHRYAVLADSPDAECILFNAACSPNIGKPVQMVWRSADGTIRPLKKQIQANVFPVSSPR